MAKNKKQAQTEYRQLRTEGNSVLVEYTKGDKLCRVIIPIDQIGEAGITPDLIEMGVPYGVAWSELIQLQATPEGFEQALYKAGIWTFEDFKHNVKLVLSILQSVYGLDVTKLSNLISEKEHKK